MKIERSLTSVRQRKLLIFAVVCALLSSAGLASALLVKSPRQVQAETAPPHPSLITAKVTRQVLATTLIFRGSVGAASTVDVDVALSSAAEATATVVSATPVRAGQSIRPGQQLLEVSGRPVVALPGAVPPYRDLKPAMKGPDVSRLQQALRELGFYHGSGTDEFDSATKRAVVRFYHSVGYDVPRIGGADDETDAAAQERAQQSVDSALRAIADAKSLAGTTSSELEALQNVLAAAVKNRDRIIATTGPMVPAAEIVYIASFPASVSSMAARVGTKVPVPAMTLSTGQLSVTSDVTPEQASLLRVGMPAEIMSEIMGTTAKGEVSAVLPRAGGGTTTNNGSSGKDDAAATDAAANTPHVPIKIETAKPLGAHWNGQDVRVTLTYARTKSEVLAVPISAITARADGRDVVTAVGPNGYTHQVAVQAGVSADGMVEVTPVAAGSLSVNDEVSVGS